MQQTNNLSLLLLVALAVPLLKLALDLLRWRNDVFAITNRRVVQLQGILNKRSIDSSLEKVNDVVLEQSLLGRLLDYGDLEILTASEAGINRLSRVAAPVTFKTTLLDQKEGLATLEDVRAGGRGTDVPDLIEKLDDLRRRGILSEAEFQEQKERLLARLAN